MSFAQPSLQDRRPSPNLALNLASNNPFRRAASPNTLSPKVLSNTPSPRPISTNPFLDYHGPPQSAQNPSSFATRPATSPKKAPPPRYEAIVAPAPSYGNVEQLIPGLPLSEKSVATASNLPIRGLPPRVGASSTAAARPLRTKEEEEDRRLRYERRRADRAVPGQQRGSPDKNENRPPRRNSDSSILDAKDLEKKQRSRRELAHDETAREGRSARPKKPNRRLDLIDKLDVTGIYGPAQFHHDGPFDACNPHRNRKGRRDAPMQAFPEGSANNTLGGSGPVNKNLDMAAYHGMTAEGFTDYNATNLLASDPYLAIKSERPTTFNAKGAEILHGEETAGLGTSTFLEGAPVPRSVAQRRESETENSGNAGSGLQRKKSVIQKLKGYSRARGEDGKVISPEPRYEYVSNMGPRTPPAGPQSAGGRPKMTEVNPFFEDEQFTASEQKKNGKVVVTEAGYSSQITGNRSRTASSPYRGLTRTVTEDSANEKEPKQAGSGLLNRVRSIKGSRRQRPEQRAP